MLTCITTTIFFHKLMFCYKNMCVHKYRTILQYSYHLLISTIRSKIREVIENLNNSWMIRFYQSSKDYHRKKTQLLASLEKNISLCPQIRKNNKQFIFFMNDASFLFFVRCDVVTFHFWELNGCKKNLLLVLILSYLWWSRI